jgi:hypothetical protein
VIVGPKNGFVRQFLFLRIWSCGGRFGERVAVGFVMAGRLSASSIYDGMRQGAYREVLGLGNDNKGDLGVKKLGSPGELDAKRRQSGRQAQGGERVHGPLLFLDSDHVEVPHHEERFLRPLPLMQATTLPRPGSSS